MAIKGITNVINAIDDLKAQVARADQNADNRDGLEQSLKSVNELVQEVLDEHKRSQEDISEQDDLSEYTWAERALLLEKGLNKVDDKNDVRDRVKDADKSKSDEKDEKESVAPSPATVAPKSQTRSGK